MQTESYSSQDILIERGAVGDKLFVVMSGEVVCSMRTPESSLGELVRLSAFEFFGESFLVRSQQLSAIRVSASEGGEGVVCRTLRRCDFLDVLLELEKTIAKQIRVDRRRQTDNVARSQNRGSIEFDELKTLQTLGTGIFGRVRLAVHNKTKSVYALKCVGKLDVLRARQEPNIFFEKQILRESEECPFVVSLITTYNLQTSVYFLLEFVQGGELWSVLYNKRLTTIVRNKSNGLNVNAITFYAANIIAALEFLHTHSVVYRDLKPENLLVDMSGFLKLVDFGLAKTLPYEKDGVLMDKTFTLCGTPEYLAPEIFLLRGYDWSVDLWALGCLLYELHFAKTPFNDLSTSLVFENILTIPLDQIFIADCDACLKSLISELLVYNPAFRLGCSSVSSIERHLKGHKLFQNIDWEQLASKRVSPPFVPALSDPTDCRYFNVFEEEDDEPPVWRKGESLEGAFVGF